MVPLFGFIVLEYTVSIGRSGNLLNYGMAEVLQDKRSVGHGVVRFLGLSSLTGLETVHLLIVVFRSN